MPREIEALPIWSKLIFQLDQGNSVRLSIPQFCGQQRLLQHLAQIYRGERKARSAVVEIAQQPTTGEIDFSSLSKTASAELGLEPRSFAESDTEFIELLKEQIQSGSRILLILHGVRPGMEAKCYGLVKSLHPLHTRNQIDGGVPQFQFVIADSFLIGFYSRQMAIDESELYKVRLVSDSPFLDHEVNDYVGAISPHKVGTPENERLTKWLLSNTGGHSGLLPELCEILARKNWPSDIQTLDARVRPSIATTSIMDQLRAAVREDRTGLAETALDFSDPDFAVEYESPRISHLLRLGILHRLPDTALSLTGGAIESLMKAMQQPSRGSARLGTVHREGGMSAFIAKRFEPAPDDFVVVHISDLHIGPDHGFRLSFSGKTVNPEAGTLADLLSKDLKDLNLLGRVDSLVVSGDIVCGGAHEEFHRASEVLEDLLGQLKLSHDRLLVVPGNHDVKWDPNEFEPTVPGNRQLSRDGYDLFLRLIGKKPRVPFDQVTLVSRGGGRRLRIIGFDSNYVEGPGTAGIGYVSKESLETAGRTLDSDESANDLPTLTWFVVHHHVLPVCDVSISDAKERRISVMGNASELLNTARRWRVESILHGHQHQPVVAYAQRWIGETGTSRFAPVLVVGAGSCGAKRERLGPISYNHYFILARQSNSVLIRSRTIGTAALSFTPHDDLQIQMPVTRRAKNS